MSKNISLLELLENEKWVVNRIRDAEDIIKIYEEEERIINDVYGTSYLNNGKREHEEKLAKATKELEDVRSEIRAYFKDVLNL